MADLGRESADRGAAPLVRAYRAAAGLAVAVAITYEVVHLNGRANWVAGNYFSYFTVISNIFAGAVMLAAAGPFAHSPPRRLDLLRGAATVYIMTTGIVYALLLSGGKAQIPWVNTVEHQVMPLVVPIDWLLVAPGGTIGRRQALPWMGFPIVYVAYTLIRGVLRHPHWYPYPFLDPDSSGGYLKVLANSIGIGVGILALIWLVCWAGNRLSRTSIST
jgi:hypothetical protein